MSQFELYAAPTALAGRGLCGSGYASVCGALDDHSSGDTRYGDSWSVVIGLVIASWLVLLGITSQARRVAK